MCAGIFFFLIRSDLDVPRMAQVVPDQSFLSIGILIFFSFANLMASS